MENLSTILNWIFGGTSLVGLMTTFFFWGKSKRKEEAQTQMQEAQAKQSNVDAASAEMDLVNKHFHDTLEMLDAVKKAQDSGNTRILDKLDKLEDKVGDIETYLNGPYHQWLADNEKRKEDNVK